MIILGINAYHGDASAALLSDGQLVAAVEEERFNRIKHAAGFPYHAVRYCLEAAGIKPADLDHIAISRNPEAHLYSKIMYSFAHVPSLNLLKSRLSNVAKIKNVKAEVAKALNVDPQQIPAEVHNVEHHHAHIASSFFVSGFDRAALLSVDGFGDFVSTMWGIGEGNAFQIFDAVEFPHSLGILYTAITQYLGFPKYGDEYKVMGLASYGEPAYLKEFDALVAPTNGLKFELDLSYFIHHREGAAMTWESGAPTLSNVFSDKLIQKLGLARAPDAGLEKRHEDIAASLQAKLEIMLFRILNALQQKTGLKKLCMAGGVALNCVASGKILDHTPFEEIYIQPAAYDAGTAIGAAFYTYHQTLKKPRTFVMTHAYWGPEYSDVSISAELRSKSAELEKMGCKARQIESSEDLCRWTAGRIADGKIVGLFQGRMEFGPRALGNRSIVVDPRRPEMKDILNKRIKHREPFRPFAPSILEEATAHYFNQSHPSPFMLMTYNVKHEKRNQIPAPTHVDGTGRLQTVSRDANLLYWTLIKEFERLTGVPVLLNTSFNENEPIVCTPGEALDCFARTKMDVLVMGNYVLEKA